MAYKLIKGERVSFRTSSELIEVLEVLTKMGGKKSQSKIIEEAISHVANNKKFLEALPERLREAIERKFQ